jgi:hypothetical protein
MTLGIILLTCIIILNYFNRFSKYKMYPKPKLQRKRELDVRQICEKEDGTGLGPENKKY